MHIMWFTERAYHYDLEVEPEKYRRLENQIIKERSFYGTPNSFFEPEHGAKILNQYIDEKVYTDQELLNFDGVMLNEHHGTPFLPGRGDGRRGRHSGRQDQAGEDRSARQSSGHSR